MKPALLLVDLQGDYLAAPGLQPVAGILTTRAAALLDECRRRGVPVIHIWTTIRRGHDHRLPHWKEAGRWLCVAGTAGHQPPARLRPLDGETVVHKTGFNAFADFTLDAALKKFHCNSVIIVGLHLHACVRTAAMECLERGLRVWIAEDAVGSNDPIHAAATRRWLAQRCVQFAPCRDLPNRLEGGAGAGLIHYSPRESKRILFEVPIAAAHEIAAVMAAAQGAWARWHRSSFSSRCGILEKVAAGLEGAAPDLARQMAAEIGKPLSHGPEEVRRAAANVRDVMGRAAAFQLQTRGAAGIVRHQPLGVVALISPWNNPVAIPIGKIAPALIYGNAVVWKPAPAATGISAAVLRLLRQAGTPRDAVQILTGDHTTAQGLAMDENVNAVTITGSERAGSAFQEICARRFVPLQAELGGNNAAIVWDGGNLPEAAAQITQGAFGFAGQRCTANRRVIVNARHLERFLIELKEAARKLVWGDPLEITTDIGPVVDVRKRDEHAALALAAKSSIASHQVEVLFVGRAAETWVKNGAYAHPVIICCDQPEHPLVQEETMSPVLVVQRAENFKQALKLCNGVRHGLAAALFSNSPRLQKKFLDEAQAGILKLNASTAGVDVTLPFGGWKASALGPPEHGEGDRLFYTRMQTVYA
jgi:acyl-CoA reductase-like NAD-dependent aldehyde dehydrogenase/nicotinamidase-related amidase